MGACERSCMGPGLGFWVVATSLHAPLSHNDPGRLVTTRPWYRQCQLLLQCPRGVLPAPGEGNRSTHGRARFHGGGGREGCQHVATLQREAKPSEFGPCQPIPQLFALALVTSHPRLLRAVVEMGPWEGYGRGQ